MTLSSHRMMVALAGIVLAAGGARAATDIGKATSIATAVTGLVDSQPVSLKTGDRIFANQTVTTDANGIGQFEFRDRTRLAVGPGSTLVLDDFVYNSKGSGTRLAIGLARGSFRFITGRSRHEAYVITTPAATIGVRGTAFDVYVGSGGEFAIAMIDGAVEVCPRSAACRIHNVIGRFLHMTVDGVFSLHDTWDGTFLSGIAFKSALPFLDDQRLLAPTLRGQTRIVARYVGGAATTVEKAVKSLPTPRLPTIRLPNLFK